VHLLKGGSPEGLSISRPPLDTHRPRKRGKKKRQVKLRRTRAPRGGRKKRGSPLESRSGLKKERGARRNKSIGKQVPCGDSKSTAKIPGGGLPEKVKDERDQQHPLRKETCAKEKKKKKNMREDLRKATFLDHNKTPRRRVRRREGIEGWDGKRWRGGDRFSRPSNRTSHTEY